MFNNNSRIKNIILSSTFGVVEQLISYIMAFVFQTVFLMVLSKSYLGISGLFTNVLQIFSLAELGIGSIIAYRMYKPISEKDISKCSALLAFYKKVYMMLFAVIVCMGVIFYPFLDHLIADTSEVPMDVNLNFIYWLFVIQSASSYLCVYMQSLPNADQKGYLISFTNTLYNITVNVVKIIFLLATHDYTVTLIAGICANLLYNIFLSMYLKYKYSEIVNEKSELEKSEKKEIFKDTWAMMCHKIGYTVVTSTDSILLSKFIGVSVLGIYSNYAMLTTAVDAMLNRLLGSFVSTIGNISVEMNRKVQYATYKKLVFINMWLSSFCAICLFVLINPFIEIWLDSSYLLGIEIVLIITSNLFLNSSRIINSVFVNANGLFVKDKFRPLIEAILNLVISVVSVKEMGIAGVFIGTIASTILTVCWREPIILYKYAFGMGARTYFVYYFKWLILTIFTGIVCYFSCNILAQTFGGFCLKVIICVVGINIWYIIIFYRTENFQYFKNFIVNKFTKS